MRIAFFVSRFPKLSEQFILNQVTGLLDRGHDVEILATLPGDSSDLHPEFAHYGLGDRTHYQFESPNQRLRHRMRRVFHGLRLLSTCTAPQRRALLPAINVLEHGRAALSFSLLFSAAQLMSRPRFDIAHCHFGQAGLAAVRLRQLGVLTGKLVTTFYGTDISKFLRTEGAAAYRPLIQHGDLFVCITDDMRSRLVSAGFPPERIQKVAVGIDLSAFAMRVRRLEPGEPVRLLTVARLVEKKGLETSIMAVAAVLRSHPNLRYRIVGDGPLRASIERLIAELGLGRHVELAGWMTQRQVREEFDASHIFVLASQTAEDGDEEGLPGVLKEAQAMGLPVVSTRHAGIPEGVLDGRSGFLVPERDAAALADRLRCLIDHPERWAEMGRAGRAFMEAHADIETLNDRLVQLYGGLLGEAAGVGNSAVHA